MIGLLELSVELPQTINKAIDDEYKQPIYQHETV